MQEDLYYKRKGKLNIDSDSQGSKEQQKLQNNAQIENIKNTNQQKETKQKIKNLSMLNIQKKQQINKKSKQEGPKSRKEQAVYKKHKDIYIENSNLFGTLAAIFEKVGNSKGEHSKIIQKNLLCNLFKQICKKDPEDLIKTYWLSVVKIGPDYEKTELGVGKQILTKAIAKSCGKSQKQLRQSLQTLGDMGQVAAASKSTQKTMESYFTKKKQPIPLTIDAVFNAFVAISKCKGNNSVLQKQNIIMKLLLDSKNEETKFIVRWIEGNLKISAAQKTMQYALIKALFEVNFSAQNQTQQNYIKYQRHIKISMAQFPNEAIIIRKLMEIKQDYEKLSDFCKITPGIPCKPMLAKPTKQVSSILSRFQNKKFTCQFKYDGLRGQIHYSNGKVQIFSRNLENMTDAYPDIVQKVQESVIGSQINSFIIDSQIVAINPKNKQILPFQILSTRARKATNVNDIEVTISVFAFDILDLNGPLTQLPLNERRKYLKQIQPRFQSIISMISSKECEQITEIDEFLQDAIKNGTEGLMIKDLDTRYSCAKRSWDWMKLKKDYIDGLGDTLDVVPIGGNYGQGRRKGIFGAYLLGIYNADLQIYQTLCKIGTGFSQQMLQAANKFFADKVIPRCPSDYKVSSPTEAEVWFTPSVVWEIKGADFQLSPIYTCGKGTVDQNRGIGLRFPRLIKVREDKKPFEATNTQFVIDLYKQQAVVQNRNQKDEDEDDFY